MLLISFGDPYRIRTDVNGVRGRCLNHLTNGPLVHLQGLEPIAVELSGGQFLQPVQTLVATIICSQRGQMQIESNKGSQEQINFGWSVLFYVVRIKMCTNFFESL